ncbi:MAG: DNA polymerase domain-containing protein [Candidatus Izemoplasmatales bacterium]|nr:DNA polymerase domain-containing protein [Candidatus Izemoplasmatales bacterium]
MLEQERKGIIDLYHNDMVDTLKLIYPHLTKEYIGKAVKESIKKRYKEVPAKLHNSYTGDEQNVNLLSVTQWILKKEPIMTAYGVLFKKHADSVNPLTDMIAMFMNNRDIHKAEMFKYPNGSEMFEKYNLFQSLDKVDCNAIYGILSAASSALYNIDVAASITAQGRSLISSATMFFEMFLSNNVKFASLDEILTFINNIRREKPQRQYQDSMILDRDISREECFAKIVLTIGDYRKGIIKWIPKEKDLEIIWNAISHLTQEDVNRIYYKNNLYEFFDNTSMTKALVYILEKMETPYLDPNKVPEEIQVELETLLSLVREYVFYNHQVIDRIERNGHMVKNVALISDTDSAIVSFDAWYHYVLNKVKGIKLKINQAEVERVVEETYNTKWEKEITEKELDFDFINDKVIEVPKKRRIIEYVTNKTMKFSILNIIAYLCGQLINEYMIAYTKTNHSYADGKKCLIIMKNEFTFGTTLITESKKNYASIQELQEGHIINNGDGKMDIKGLPMTKSTVCESTKKDLQALLKDEVLMANEIDQIRIIKKLAILEKKIYESIRNGDKEYYKPASIKALDSYSDPMRIQGIKGAVIWNAVRDPELEAIDLEARNRIDIAKVKIDEENIIKIKDKYPEVYQRFVDMFKDDSIIEDPNKKKGNLSPQGRIKKSITSIAIPTEVQVPKWVLEFIDYTTIINDNLSNFPKEPLNIITMNNDNVNYSNIMKI